MKTYLGNDLALARSVAEVVNGGGNVLLGQIFFGEPCHGSQAPAELDHRDRFAIVDRPIIVNSAVQKIEAIFAIQNYRP